MLFTPTSPYLFVLEHSGASVDLNYDNCKPIQMALAFEGGIVKCCSIYIDSLSKVCYWIQYHTHCLKIKIIVELTKEEYLHNLDFFGSDDGMYPKTSFELDGNKFKMPQ